MKNILTNFVKFPFYANIVLVVIVLFGVISLSMMTKSFFPETKSRIIVVSVAYPGASPKEMEEGITTRIEEAIRSIVGIKEINSTSSENFATVNIETTGEFDLDETLMEIKNAVDGISSFPTAAEKPIVFKRRTRTQAAYMGLSGDVDLKTLKNYAQKIEEDLLSSGVMSQVSIGGYPDLEVSVEVSEENLLRYGLTFDFISNAIAMNNRDVSAGMIKSDEEEILIRSRERSVDPNVIGEIILRANDDGSFLRIRDIADVKLKFADVSNYALINGKRGVFFSVEKLGNEDVAEISEYINNYIEDFNSKHNDVKLQVTFDFNYLLDARLNLLLENGSIGLALVLLSLGLFLSLRLSFWVAIGIPVSFLSMFIVANIVGVTINMISLFGMILVIGILVDDGIVIGENIFSHIEKGKSGKRAAIDGTMEVFPAVVTSVTTTMIAFMPIMLITGRMEMLYEMAFIVVVSLGFSLIEAFFVLPAHLSTLKAASKDKAKSSYGKVRAQLDKIIYYLRDVFYARILKEVIRWRWIVAVVPVALWIITAGMFAGGVIQSTFFPQIAFDMFNVNVAFKAGSGEKQTIEFLEKFDQAIWEVNSELKEKYNDPNDYITFTFRSLGNAFNGQEAGAHAGNVNVLMRDMEDAPISTFEIAGLVRQKIGPVPEAEKFTVGGRNRWGSPVSISLLGRNLEELQKARDYLFRELSEMEKLKNVNDNNAQGKQEIRLKLKPQAYFLGLNQNEIAKQVRQGFYGGQVQRLQSGKDEIRVWVRYPKQDRLSMGQLEDMKIKTPKGEYPLTELVTYHIERGPVNIQRYNGSREVRIDADLTDPYEPVPPILEEIQANILPDLEVQYPGIRIVYQGQARSSQESGTQLAGLFGIAIVVIMLIIIIHFKSVFHMLFIMLMIPIAYLGVVWGHGIHGHPISILSAWGMVALSGVIINDAVVFLSRYNQLLLEGMTVNEAAFNAGISRYRAILLTTLTTTLGLFPLIMETSFQAQFLIPMAISLAYGVLVGTGFILLFFPVIILCYNDLKVNAIKLWTGKKPTSEEVEPAIIRSKVTLDD